MGLTKLNIFKKLLKMYAGSAETANKSNKINFYSTVFVLFFVSTNHQHFQALLKNLTVRGIPNFKFCQFLSLF